MATCAEKKEAWQERVVTIEDPDTILPLSLAAPDVLYSCEGAITYAPLNSLGYYLPEVNRGTQKFSGTGAVATTLQAYLEITDVEDYTTLLLHGRRYVFEYDIESDCRIGPLGIYNVGTAPRFTIFPGTPSVELVLETAPVVAPADVDEPPEMSALDS